MSRNLIIWLCWFFFSSLALSARISFDTNLMGKVVLITGGASGIGEATALLFASEDATVVVLDRDIEKGEAVNKKLKEYEETCLFIATDFTDEVQYRRAIESVAEKFGRIDILVNNVGTNDGVGLESGIKAFRTSLEKNLIHYYGMMHYALPYLKESKGTVINVASKVALTGQGHTSGYAASKGAILALTREWACELAGMGIRVNAVAPAEVMTPQYKKWIDELPNPEAKMKEVGKMIPLGHRFTEAHEIAKAIVALASDIFSHSTGETFFCDGGYIHLDRAITASKL